MPNDTIKGRISTMRHTMISQVAKNAAKRYTAKDHEYAKQMQIEILCEGNPDLWQTCITCGTPTDKRNDHYISLIKDKKPQPFGSHPLNMVHCCPNSKCNNEKNKEKIIKRSERHRKYFEFVKEKCPHVIDVNKLIPLFEKMETTMTEMHNAVEDLCISESGNSTCAI